MFVYSVQRRKHCNKVQTQKSSFSSATYDTRLVTLLPEGLQKYYSSSFPNEKCMFKANLQM